MRLPAVFALSICAVLAPSAHAASSYESCKGFIDTLPTTITTQGTWCLRKDLSTAVASGNAITIDANNVTIDCNGFKLGGLGAGPLTSANGIYSSGRLNGGVRGCAIRGFSAGVQFDAGGGALIENNLFEGNTWTAIFITGDGGTVRGNRIFDTGGGSSISAYGMLVVGNVDVLDNTIDNVFDESAYGIYTSGNLGGTVGGNRIRGLDYTENGIGVENDESDRVTVRDNHIAGPVDIGVMCTNNHGTSGGNIISGAITGVWGCTSLGDAVNTN